MGTLVVIELQETLYGVFSGARFAKGPSIQALLIQGAMRALHLTVLFRRSHWDELMANTLRSQGLFEGVRLLYMREKDVGKLRAVVGLNLLDGEGEGAKQTVKEKDAGLRSKFRTDPSRLKASTIINGRIEVLLKRLGTVPETQMWQIFFTSSWMRWPGISMA